MGPNGFVFFLEIADLALLLPMLESTADDFDNTGIVEDVDDIVVLNTRSCFMC